MASKVSVSYHSSTSDDDTASEDIWSLSDEEQNSNEEVDSTPRRYKKLHAKQELNNNGKDAVFDVMSKILSKQSPKTCSVILSKGATDKQIAKKRKNSEAGSKKEGHSKRTNESSDEDSEMERQKLAERKRQKFLWENMARVKPDILDKEKERNLQKIATRGVVQLFNAVRKQQRIVDSKLEEVGPSIRKQERVIKTMTKGKFLDILKGTQNANISNEPVENKLKQEMVDLDIKKEKTEPAWDILREDFMLGAEMKDWDQADDDNVHNNYQESHDTCLSNNKDSNT